MKLLKLIPAAAILLTAFTTFEAKAGYPSGWTSKNNCTGLDGSKYYKLQKTDTPASWGVYSDQKNDWIVENVSYDCASQTYKYYCGKTSYEPSCLYD